MKSRVGRCRLHGFKLTYRQLKQRGCIDSKKQRGAERCHHFAPYWDHPVWEMRERLKAEKKERRMMRDGSG